MMMADTMDALGLAGKYVVKVNSRKVLDGVLQAIGVVTDDQRLTVLRAIDKLDRLGFDGVRQILGEGRTDASGDFTTGAGLDSYQIERLAGFFEFPLLHHTTPCAEDPERASRDMEVIETWFVDNDRAISGLRTLFPEIEAAVDDLAAMVRSFDAAGYGSRRIRIDPSVVRGLEYYTGPVFEIELTFKVQNEKGQDVVFGSVGGGGRYDGLVSRFRSEPVPAPGSRSASPASRTR